MLIVIWFSCLSVSLLYFCDCSLAVGGNVNDRLSARRSLKADREKIRRDKLNEQFSELASSLGK